MPRELLRELKEQTGRHLSFTAYVIYCCAIAVNENKQMHAYRDWRNRLVLFDDVDVWVPIDRPEEGHNVGIFPAIIRAANRKSVIEIHDEIRRAQSGSLPEGVPATVFRHLRWYAALPGFVRRPLYRLIWKIPRLVKRYGGTITVTSVGMFSHGAGWGIPMSNHTLTITVGGIVSRPVANDAQMENRQQLCLTASFDHSIIDGAPAARFVQRIKELLESGTGLPGIVRDGVGPAKQPTEIFKSVNL